MYKSVIFLTIVLLSSHATQIGRGLQEDAEGLVAELMEVVHGSIDSGELRLRYHIEEIEIITDTYITVGTGQIREVLDEIVAQILAIEHLAQEANVDISQCINRGDSDLINLETSVVSNLSTCITTESTSLQYAVSRVSRTLSEISGRASTVENNLNQCKTLEENQECFANVIGLVPYLMTSLPASVRSAVEAAIAQTEVAKVRFEQCGIGPIERTIIEGTEIVNEIKACADQLMSG